MTEFEIASLNTDMAIAVTSTSSLFVGALTAFLVASYVAAHRLTRTMAAIVVGLFVVFSLQMAATINSQLNGMAGLAHEMKALAQAGKGFAWNGVATIPEGAIYVTSKIPPALVLIAIFAAIYFFFHCRRVNRKAETSQAPTA